jgi:hypothetical protein
MATIYDYETGYSLTEGLQGCTVCDEAIQAAERFADEREESVELHDDDGRWLVHPASEAGERKPASFLGPLPAAEEDQE